MNYRVWAKLQARHYALIGRGSDPRAPHLRFSFINVVEMDQPSTENIAKLVKASATYLEQYSDLKLMPITRERFEREAARSELISG